MLPKFRYMLSIVVFILAALSSDSLRASACSGCINLDDLTFDKTIARFPYTLVKFDLAFPYGEKHEAFSEFSKAAHKATNDLLIATVGIKDYGENENKALGDRFGVDKKTFPGIFLFEGNSNKFVKWPDHLDVTLENLKSFVTKNSKLYIGREGCIKEYNQLAENYANLDKETRNQRIAKAESLLKDLKENWEKTNAKIYISFMKKINKQGYNFVEDETIRLLRLKAGKVSNAKKIEFQEKLNILESFKVTRLTKNITEEL